MTLGRELIHLASVASTMDVVDEYARAGAAEGLVVVADEQTAGRGRAGRVWSAVPGSSLLCSILLRPSLPADRLGPLPLAVGVAVAETIESFVPRACGLKWPNDVLIDGRKVAGILLQSRLSARGMAYLIVGIGINVGASLELLPEGATSISASGGDADRESVLATLIARLDRVYRIFLETDGRPDLAEWRRRAVMIGERVTIRRDTDELSGRFKGIDDRGRLLLVLDSGEQVSLIQGDVVRGPRAS